MHFVGIDWSAENHQVAVINEEGKVVGEWRIDDNWKGFSLLNEHLSTLSPVIINIERQDGLLVEWLISQGYEVMVTPPRISAGYRPRHSKDDRQDARILAQMLRMKDKECRPVIRHSPIVEELRQLVRALEQIQRDIVRLANRLREILKAYYPTMVALFKDVSSGIALAFLKTHPNIQVAKALSIDDLESFLRQHRYNHMRRLNEIHQTIQKVVPETKTFAGYQVNCLGIALVLEALNAQESHLRKEIQRVFASHPESSWWAKLPGAGELTAPRLFAWFGDNREAFSNKTMLQAIAGTVPVTRQSGKQRSVQFRWACHKALRKAVMDFARNSIKHSTWARSYWYSQLEQGHSSQRAYRALANRWLSILWTIWQKREAYDEYKHIANRSHNGQRLVAKAV